MGGAASDITLGIAEPLLNVTSGMLAEPIAGLAGLATGNPDVIDPIHHRLTYQPASEAGKAGLGRVAGGLSAFGHAVMDAPYVGAAIRNYGESTDALGEYSPALGAALKAAPMAAAMLMAPEAESAFSNVGGEIGRTIAEGGNIGRAGMAAQKGAITIGDLADAFKFVRGGGSKLGRASLATEGLSSTEGALARAGREGVDVAQNVYTAEQQQKKQGKGRVLFHE